ncbi:MAG: methyltransferase type 11 [Candidatus Yanofskybacteria bacterium RIFCSPHIGHO2_02_FULL_41_29]|uniref:Methyltransferase type 11 n=1 Tax=Candidatus Yanofskybacteria bacterium RIFCSPHIGHO2_01_FULL_41_53 TaxID=1802663 RepID=A0A1F8ELL9_9BACT|nr:MAG: methyltransferase type 11 [Candidatus Yanofskybacteria bacterium RIFCSPHIGHO2_01_FULL_41_53]OGN10272.1 MAG: methyltransferase type 11 [Candidatus Yanofskybacteria bacterium RIFCSPHIGHO2_02_FULL_41_29]OGN30521.1 MAG: methyltransferase type 11 [Candidatus Yanofskybacteria bacterium RIFCSPLOWO2_02_FULL_41_13]
MKSTAQEKFWSSEFGKEYMERNTLSLQELNKLYTTNFGVSRSRINKDFLGKLKIGNILEIGCNVGNQLALLQEEGFKNLYGIEIFPKAVELAKTHTKSINIVQGSGFDLPFKDNSFDLVFTAGVLIHISPKDIKKIMKEIHRVSKKYIWGFEYFSPDHIAIPYRGNKDRLWKGDFAKMYTSQFPDLKLVKEKRYKYLQNDNLDCGFLLKK